MEGSEGINPVPTETATPHAVETITSSAEKPDVTPEAITNIAQELADNPQAQRSLAERLAQGNPGKLAKIAAVIGPVALLLSSFLGQEKSAPKSNMTDAELVNLAGKMRSIGEEATQSLNATVQDLAKTNTETDSGFNQIKTAITNMENNAVAPNPSPPPTDSQTSIDPSTTL